MKRPRGTARSIVVLLVTVAAALIWAAPVAAAPPTRTVFDQGGATVVIPAGFGCAFDVHAEVLPGSRIAVTEFADGRVAYLENADAILANGDTGATFYHRARFSGVDVYDPDTNLVTSTINGQVNIWLAPGDEGPFGTVEEPGAFYRYVGVARYTWDATTFVVTEFDFDGTATDVCGLLS